MTEEIASNTAACGSGTAHGWRHLRGPDRLLVNCGTRDRLYGALPGRKGSPRFADRMRSARAAMSIEHFPGRIADALALQRHLGDVPGIVFLRQDNQ